MEVLPTDCLLQVFLFLPQTDLKTLRLVSKQLSVIASSNLLALLFWMLLLLTSLLDCGDGSISKLFQMIFGEKMRQLIPTKWVARRYFFQLIQFSSKDLPPLMNPFEKLSLEEANALFYQRRKAQEEQIKDLEEKHFFHLFKNTQEMVQMWRASGPLNFILSGLELDLLQGIQDQVATLLENSHMIKSL